MPDGTDITKSPMRWRQRVGQGNAKLNPSAPLYPECLVNNIIGNGGHSCCRLWAYTGDKTCYPCLLWPQVDYPTIQYSTNLSWELV